MSTRGSSGNHIPKNGCRIRRYQETLKGSGDEGAASEVTKGWDLVEVEKSQEEHDVQNSGLMLVNVHQSPNRCFSCFRLHFFTYSTPNPPLDVLLSPAVLPRAMEWEKPIGQALTSLFSSNTSNRSRWLVGFTWEDIETVSGCSTARIQLHQGFHFKQD